MPTAVAFDGTFLAVATGRQTSCGLAGDGKIYCWGGDTADVSGGPYQGQLGDGGTAEDKAVPVAIDSALRFVGLTVGWDHACGHTYDGNTHCWGRNSAGAFGSGTTAGNNLSPVPVGHTQTFLSFTAGEQHTCGLVDDGKAYCTGAGGNRALATGNQTNQASPTVMDASAPDFRALSVNYLYGCGVATGGSGYCWGLNTYGQVGNTSTTDALAPTLIDSSDKLSMIVTGYSHTCALTAANAAMCWGRDTDEQLANGAGLTSLTTPPTTYISVEQ